MPGMWSDVYHDLRGVPAVGRMLVLLAAIVVVGPLALAGSPAPSDSDADAAARRAMVERQIKARGISDERVRSEERRVGKECRL